MTSLCWQAGVFGGCKSPTGWGIKFLLLKMPSWTCRHPFERLNINQQYMYDIRTSVARNVAGADWGEKGQKWRPKAGSGAWLLGREQRAPLHQLGGLWGHWNLPHRSPRRRPGRRRNFGHDNEPWKCPLQPPPPRSWLRHCCPRTSCKSTTSHLPRWKFWIHQVWWIWGVRIVWYGWRR